MMRCWSSYLLSECCLVLYLGGKCAKLTTEGDCFTECSHNVQPTTGLYDCLYNCLRVCLLTSQKMHTQQPFFHDDLCWPVPEGQTIADFTEAIVNNLTSTSSPMSKLSEIFMIPVASVSCQYVCAVKGTTARAVYSCPL